MDDFRGKTHHFRKHPYCNLAVPVYSRGQKASISFMATAPSAPGLQGVQYIFPPETGDIRQTAAFYKKTKGAVFSGWS